MDVYRLQVDIRMIVLDLSFVIHDSIPVFFIDIDTVEKKILMSYMRKLFYVYPESNSN